jgi:hypothetical protein
VVLEGTTSTSGQLAGAITEKGALNGDLRDWFLSDRWFNYESPINAELNLATTTALADEIKDVLVGEGRSMPMPSKPPKPIYPQKPMPPTRKKRGFFNPKTVVPPHPEAPTLPAKTKVTPTPFERNSWATNFKGILFNSLLLPLCFLLVLNVSQVVELFPINVVERLAIFFGLLHGVGRVVVDVPQALNLLVLLDLNPQLAVNLLIISFFLVVYVPVSAWEAVNAEERRRVKHDAKNKKLKELSVEAGRRDSDFYDLKMRQYQMKLDEREKKVAALATEERDDRLLESNYFSETKRYDADLVRHAENIKLIDSDHRKAWLSYEACRQEVLDFRSELWSKTRVCTRCGATYLTSA